MAATWTAVHRVGTWGRVQGKRVWREVSLGRVMMGWVEGMRWTHEIFDRVLQGGPRERRKVRYDRVVDEQVVWLTKVGNEVRASRCLRAREGCPRCEDGDEGPYRSDLFFEGTDDENLWERVWYHRLHCDETLTEEEEEEA